MGPGAQGRFDRYYARVIRMTHAAQGYRGEAGEALGQYSASISGRQGQVINVLTVISVIFLPLTFLTGYFGMNFDVVTQDLKDGVDLHPARQRAPRSIRHLAGRTGARPRRAGLRHGRARLVFTSQDSAAW